MRLQHVHQLGENTNFIAAAAAAMHATGASVLLDGPSLT